MAVSNLKAVVRREHIQKRVLEDKAARFQQVTGIHLKQPLGRGKTSEMEVQCKRISGRRPLLVCRLSISTMAGFRQQPLEDCFFVAFFLQESLGRSLFFNTDFILLTSLLQASEALTGNLCLPSIQAGLPTACVAGTGAGLFHSLSGPDHLAALAPLALRTSGPAKAFRTGSAKRALKHCKKL